MPRKTLALIAGLVLVTVVLFVIALRTGQQNAPDKSQMPQAQKQSPDSSAKTILSIEPNPLSVTKGGQGKAEVMIDASDLSVTGIQLQMSYDPNYITNVQLAPGALVPNAVVLRNLNNAQTGKITYEFAIQPNQPVIKGKGVVATITFTAKPTASGQTQLALLPNSLVSARGIAQSVLKTATGTTVTFK